MLFNVQSFHEANTTSHTLYATMSTACIYLFIVVFSLYMWNHGEGLNTNNINKHLACMDMSATQPISRISLLLESFLKNLGSQL